MVFNPMTKDIEKVIEEFDRVYGDLVCPDCKLSECINVSLKNFIRQSLLSRNELVEEMKGLINDMSYAGVLDSNEQRRGYDIARTEIFSLLESLKTKE